jgi:glycosyltransferase involved in cell wall biosynthesis
LLTPKVSIFLPTFARYQDGFLQRAVDSALRQTWREFELLVIDDGSTDGTADYLASQAAVDPRLVHIRLEKNTGLPAYALAQAYPHATGEYFAWLFDDCELEPDHLETLVERLRERPSLGMVYAQARAQLQGDRSFVIGAPLDIGALSQGANSIPNTCVVLPRSTIERVGWYDPHIILKRLCDWDLWLRVAAEFEIDYVDRILATEYGVGLPGSLGRLNQENGELALKYARLPRNHRLAPENLSMNDAYRMDFEAELGASDAAALQTAFLEHQILTMDIVESIKTAGRMKERGLLDDAIDHLHRQGNVTGEVKVDILFAAMVGYFRKRIEDDAASMIKMEVAARDALRAADQRMEEMNLALERLTATQAERDSLSIRLSDIESRGEKTVVERFNEEVSRELADTKYSLFIFRDAADRRLEMIRALEEQLGNLSRSSFPPAELENVPPVPKPGRPAARRRKA